MFYMSSGMLEITLYKDAAEWNQAKKKKKKKNRYTFFLHYANPDKRKLKLAPHWGPPLVMKENKVWSLLW